MENGISLTGASFIILASVLNGANTQTNIAKMIFACNFIMLQKTCEIQKIITEVTSRQ